jgi:hypothetical protein
MAQLCMQISRIGAAAVLREALLLLGCEKVENFLISNFVVADEENFDANFTDECGHKWRSCACKFHG